MRHIILISGKDSLATAIVQFARAPDLPYELVHNDTGWDLPETVEWIERVGRHFDRDIVHCGDDLTEICVEQNCLPLAGIRRFCTKYAKIKPLNDYLGSAPSTVYFGLRADEPDRIGYVVPPKQEMRVRYPLRELGFGLADAWRLCEGVDLLPPQFWWGWMETRVRHILGRDQFLLDDLPPWQRATLLAWRSRSNCAHCMYQRQYERIGCYEHHPDIFDEGCLLEEKLCHKPEFTWVKGYRLRDLIPRAAEIKERRAQAICKFMRTKLQRSLFEDDDLSDELAVTSCGLLCGK